MRKNKKRRGIILLTLVIIFIFATISVMAVSEQDVLVELHEDGLDQTFSFISVSHYLRSFGFWIIKGLGTVIDVFQKGLSVVVSFLSFAKSTAISQYISSFLPTLKVLFGLSITFVGLYFFIKPGDRESTFIQNIIICMIIIFALPTISSHLVNLTQDASSAVLDTYGQTTVVSGDASISFDDYSGAQGRTSKTDISSIASSVFSENVVDLLLVDHALSDSNKTPWRDGSCDFNGGSSWKKININAGINYDLDTSLSNSNVWKRKIYDGYNSSLPLEKLDDGFTSNFNEYYYRYQVRSWLAIILQEILIAVILVFTTFKVALLVWNVIQTLIFMPFIAVTDLASGQRIKETVKGLIALFAAIFLAIVLMGVFFIGYDYIITFKYNGEKVHFLIKAVLIIALSAAVIDGPDLIERIIGVDVGVKSGFKTAMAAYGIGKSISGAVKGVKRAGAGALSAATIATVGRKGQSELKETNPITHGQGLRGIFGGKENRNAPLMPNEDSAQSRNYRANQERGSAFTSSSSSENPSEKASESSNRDVFEGGNSASTYDNSDERRNALDDDARNETFSAERSSRDSAFNQSTYEPEERRPERKEPEREPLQRSTPFYNDSDSDAIRHMRNQELYKGNANNDAPSPSRRTDAPRSNSKKASIRSSGNETEQSKKSGEKTKKQPFEVDGGKK